MRDARFEVATHAPPPRDPRNEPVATQEPPAREAGNEPAARAEGRTGRNPVTLSEPVARP
jgi:hypothetical protein